MRNKQTNNNNNNNNNNDPVYPAEAGSGGSGCTHPYPELVERMFPRDPSVPVEVGDRNPDSRIRKYKEKAIIDQKRKTKRENHRP